MTADDIEPGLALMSRRVTDQRLPSPVDPDLVIHAWKRLIKRRAIASRLLESPDLPASRNLITFGLSAFVRKSWLDEYLRSPFPHAGRFVIEHCALGHADEFLLRDSEVMSANSGTGLDALTLGIGWAPDRVSERAFPECLQLSARTFHEAHDGYRLASILSECFEGADCEFFLGGGSWRRRSTYDRYYDRADSGSRATPAPVLVGLTKSEADQGPHASALTASLFVHRDLRYGFDPGQQELLLGALDHVSDKELEQVLGVGSHALRRRWQRIFRRIEALQPADDPVLPPGCELGGKRARVLLRMRSEMYELRPHTYRCRLRKIERRR